MNDKIIALEYRHNKKYIKLIFQDNMKWYGYPPFEFIEFEDFEFTKKPEYYENLIEELEVLIKKLKKRK